MKSKQYGKDLLYQNIKGGRIMREYKLMSISFSVQSGQFSSVSLAQLARFS